MRPFRSVGGRLALALLLVVAGVLAIVYLIVVPSYKASLENNELNTLQKLLQGRAVPNYPLEPWMKQQFASTQAPRLNARVVVFNLQNETPALLEPYADSNAEGDSSDVVNDPVAFDAILHQTLARGTVTRRGAEFAEVAYPIGASVLMLSAPLHDQLQVVSVVRKRVFVAGALAMAFAALLGYAGASLFTRRISRLESVAEQIAAGNFDVPVVDHGTDELGQLARTFERMRLRLSRLDRARGEFIANASHELRTPLFSLGAFLELMDDPGLDDPTREEFLQQMREQVARLTKLATDLLDLSRLDAGRLIVVSEPVELAELADEVLAEFGGRFSERRIERTLEPAAAYGDAERVLQIGRILLENALVHTLPDATVRVSTSVDGGRATLTVANDGAEIPREAQQQIFERFYRLDGTKASGSGLGLAIARELAEVMGGRIELDSQNGWTLFTLVLSAETPDHDLAANLS